MSLAADPPPAALPRPDRGASLVAGGLLAVLAVTIAGLTEARQGLLFVIGGLMGAALYHAAFGFTGGWRRLVRERRGASMRAQMLMVGLAALVFIPVLAQGGAFGVSPAGAIAPVGVSVLVGAALFGLGMQLGGGCGSGTLFTVGGGSVRMLVTLVFFCVGALIGTAHLPWWLEQPALGRIALGTELGWAGGLAVTLAGLAAVALITVAVERGRHGALERPAPAASEGLARLARGPWPLVWAAVALALLNVATFFVAGHTWSITYGFGLWAAKAAQALGVPVETWAFWTWPYNARALSSSVLMDTVSVMNFGIILGAALAAGLAGRFAPAAALPWPSLAAAVIGGLLMGYGARLGFGCNIGALFSGIASGSLHGWLWFAAAFAGSWVGIRLRPAFRLD